MAVISALLIAAVVAVIAGGMLTRQTLFTRSLECAGQLRVQGTARLPGGVQLSRQLLSGTPASASPPDALWPTLELNPSVMPGSGQVDTPVRRPAGR